MKGGAVVHQNVILRKRGERTGYDAAAWTDGGNGLTLMGFDLKKGKCW